MLNKRGNKSFDIVMMIMTMVFVFMMMINNCHCQVNQGNINVIANDDNKYENMYEGFWEYIKNYNNRKNIGDFFGGTNIHIDPNKTKQKEEKTNPVCLEDSDSSSTSQTGPSEDTNLKFIKGKCNPVLLIPGIYGTRLLLTINCKLFKQNDPIKFKQSRLFCGKSVCPKESIQHEEHVLFPALYNSPFTLIESDNYSSCIGFFMKFHNNISECPAMKDGSEICLHSPAVKISYYGSTKHTVTHARCGVAAVQNVLYTGMIDAVEKLANVGAAKVFKGMSDHLKTMGYNEGFSYGAIPHDYRRFIATNKFSTKAFQYQINRLYYNTGKPVIIIAHSYGTLHTLNQLISMDKELQRRIKTFIAIAPPFSGSSKSIDFFLNGSKDFDTHISIGPIDLIKVKFDSYGQQINYNTLPTLIELRPQPQFSKMLQQDERYVGLYTAINEMMDVEAKYSKGIMKDSDIIDNMKNFNKEFGEAFPSFTNAECKKFNNKLLPEQLMYHPCNTRTYNFMKCPMLIKTNPLLSLPEIKSPLESSISSLCAIDGISERETLLDALLFNGNCISSSSNTKTGKRCLDNLYNSPPYPFYSTNPKLLTLINYFNSNFSHIYNDTLTPTDSLFETKTSFQAKTNKLVDYHSTISRIQNLPIPPVDTVVIYSNFLPTKTSFIYQEDDPKDKFPEDDIIFRGGDETVPNWSTLLVGMKWLYDKKHNTNVNPNGNENKQKITLVEYCSLLSNEGRFQYDWKEKDYYAIGCDCFKDDDPNKGYDEVKLKGKQCNHSTMINDVHLIQIIHEQYLIDRSIISSSNTPSVLEAIKRYNSDKDYEQECNADLMKISDKDKKRP